LDQERIQDLNLPQLACLLPVAAAVAVVVAAAAVFAAVVNLAAEWWVM
jgi:hypothetical protein